MSTFLKINKKNVINIILWLIIILLFTVVFNFLPVGSYCVVISFLIFNTIISAFSKEIRFSMPMLIYRITGLIRYVFIPIAMHYQNISIIYSKNMILIMCLELFAILFGVILFCKKNSNIINSNFENDSLSILNSSSLKLGLPSTIIMIIGLILVFYNRSFIERYLVLGSDKATIVDVSGGISILLSCFFLLFFVGMIKFIKNNSLFPDFLKVLISLLISVIYINGSSITGNNVSRWSILICSIISFVFITKLYPNYRKRLSILMIAVIVFSVTFASIIKFDWNDNYSTIEKTIEEELRFNTLNSYFNGPKNMQIALELKNDIENSNTPKYKIFISDTFGNFPLLNSYLSDDNYRSAYLFNYKYYGSGIAKDQIIPFSNQLYSIFSIFFVVIEIIIVYLSFFLFFKYKKENNYLNIYCYIYMSFFLSLTNCINYSIMMQTLWIYVLPVCILSILNSKMAIKKKNSIDNIINN